MRGQTTASNFEIEWNLVIVHMNQTLFDNRNLLVNGLRLLPTSNPFNDVLPSLVDYFTAAMQYVLCSVYIIAHKSEKSFMMKIAAADKRSLSEVCLGFLRYIRYYVRSSMFDHLIPKV